MPKLPSEHIHARTPADGNVHIICRAHVNTSGVFFMEIPETHFDSFNEFASKLPGGMHRDFDFNGIEVKGNIGDKMAFTKGAKSNNYQQLIRFFTAALEFHHTAEVKEEKILVYSYSSGLRYWKNPDGTLVAHGAVKGATDYNLGGKWAGSPDARDSIFASHDGITLCCFCLMRTTYTRAKSIVTKYAKFRDDNGAPQTHGDLINYLSPGVCPKGADELRRNQWKTIPYDDKSAAYFYNTLHSLARIDDSLRTFFSSEERVAAAITSGQMPLLK